MLQDNHLREKLEQQVRRLRQAERERPTLLGQTVYLGTLGLMFVLPIVGGAYLGLWLDDQADGYSTRWTISLILAGIGVGVLNVYLLVRE